MVDHTSAHWYDQVWRLPLFFSYETFNLARVVLLAIVVMIVGLAWLSSFNIVADLSRGISGIYGDNARFSGVRGTCCSSASLFAYLESLPAKYYNIARKERSAGIVERRKYY